MPKDIDSPYKDYIGSKPSFNVKETLGDRPGQPTSGSGAGLDSKVTPKELPSQKNDLWYGPR